MEKLLIKKTNYALIIVLILILLSCKSEPNVTAEHHIINNSGQAILLKRYGKVNETKLIENKQEYSFTYYAADSPVAPPPFYDSSDSIVIEFNDAKRLTYTPSQQGKSIYDILGYEKTEVETGKKRYYHSIFKFYITQDDYEQAQ